MKPKLALTEAIHVASIDEYLAAFEDGYTNIYYRGGNDAELLDALRRRGEDDIYYRYQYAKELYTCREYEAAFELHKQLAEDGFEFGKLALAVCYYMGRGCEVDKKKSFDLLKEIEELDKPVIYHDLAMCYGYGEGVEKDLDKAIEYYLKAVDYIPNSGLGLAKCYIEKLNDWPHKLEENPEESEKLSEKTEEDLENYYIYQKRILNAYIKAAHLGNRSAMCELIDRYESDGDIIAAQAWKDCLARIDDPTLPLAPGGKYMNPGRYIKGDIVVETLGTESLEDLFKTIKDKSLEEDSEDE